MLRRLPLSPRALRFFVVALAWVQLVAPTWHICALGGHVASHHETAAHPLAHQAPAASVSDDATQPLICFCAAHPRPLDPLAPHLDGTTSPDHATCLAMLLQTLPGQLLAPPAPVSTREIVAASPARVDFVSLSVEAPRHLPARAPPEEC